MTWQSVTLIRAKCAVCLCFTVRVDVDRIVARLFRNLEAKDDNGFSDPFVELVRMERMPRHHFFTASFFPTPQNVLDTKGHSALDYTSSTKNATLTPGVLWPRGLVHGARAHLRFRRVERKVLLSPAREARNADV